MNAAPAAAVGAVAWSGKSSRQRAVHTVPVRTCMNVHLRGVPRRLARHRQRRAFTWSSMPSAHTMHAGHHQCYSNEMVPNGGFACRCCTVAGREQRFQAQCSCACAVTHALVQAVWHIAQRVAALHEAGYAHRDLKPSNTMWLTRENKWTLIDFGCTARIGCMAPLSYSLGYAAPEVVAAARAGEQAISVTAALDCWALGVMVMELFAGRGIFTRMHGTEAVRRVVNAAPRGAARRMMQQSALGRGPCLTTVTRRRACGRHAATHPLRGTHASLVNRMGSLVCPCCIPQQNTYEVAPAGTARLCRVETGPCKP